MKQMKFSFFKNDYKKAFGGSLLVGKRKSKRPLTTKSPIHLILKSDQRKVFQPFNKNLQSLILDTAKEFNVKIYDLALNWSHIHFLIKLKNKNDYNKFIRALTSRLAIKLGKKLFTLRPFTRIISWGRDFKNALQYILKNQKEAQGTFRKGNRKPPS